MYPLDKKAQGRPSTPTLMAMAPLELPEASCQQGFSKSLLNWHPSFNCVLKKQASQTYNNELHIVILSTPDRIWFSVPYVTCPRLLQQIPVKA